MSYSELDVLSNAYAYKLNECGVKKGDIVAVISARSHELFIALIGILKLGAAYMPIDPDYPDERINNISELNTNDIDNYISFDINLNCISKINKY